MPFFELLFWLLVGHAVADFALQNQYVATAKSPLDPHGKTVWGWVLGSHALIHGGFVAFITGYIWLGLLEVVAHFVIDYAKTTNRFGQHPRAYHIDQSLHVACKVVWAAIALLVSNLSL